MSSQQPTCSQDRSSPIPVRYGQSDPGRHQGHHRECTSIPAGAVTVQATGNITLGSSASGATVGSGAIAVLHAGGSIMGGTTGTRHTGARPVLITDGGPIGITHNRAAQRSAANLLAAGASNNANINLSRRATNRAHP